jgi:hypothetical protein
MEIVNKSDAAKVVLFAPNILFPFFVAFSIPINFDEAITATKLNA